MVAQRRSLGTMVSLVGIWMAVVFAGVFGRDIVTETGGRNGSRSKVPAVVPVAAMAAAATLFVTWFAYRSEKVRVTPAAERDRDEPTRELGTTLPVPDWPVAAGQR